MSVKIGAVKIANIAKEAGIYENFTGWILVADLSKKVEDASFTISESGEIEFKVK